jgi:hypothetical protein
MTTTIFSSKIENRNLAPFGRFNRSVLRFLALLVALSAATILLFSVIRLTRIGAGYVGVEVNLAGSRRGAQDIPVRTGWMFYCPLMTQVIAFPTFVQTVKWTADVNEGHPLNEELVFNSKEGQEVRADVSLSYAIEAARYPNST